MIAQKMMIGSEALGERHRQRADRVAEQPEHVGALAADQVADLAADQDERGGDERLERDRATGRRSPSCRGRATTAEIDTFMSEVSTTSTNIAIASKTASVTSPVDCSAAPPRAAEPTVVSTPIRRRSRSADPVASP